MSLRFNDFTPDTNEKTLSMKPEKISEFTTRRLSIYLRSLNQLTLEGVETISSQSFAERFNLNSAQIRKDLAYFGEFGVRGVGYDTEALRKHLIEILGLNRRHRVGIIGAGNLGLALANYKNWTASSFNVVALFDNDTARIGKTSLASSHASKNSDGVKIYDVRDFPTLARELELEMVALAVPRETAQSALDMVVEAGIKAVLNFAPAQLEAPEDVQVKTVDLTISLESLSYFLAQPTSDEVK